MHWKLFADLAERAGTREVSVSVAADDPTVADALAALTEMHPALADRLFDEGGAVRSQFTLLKNGEPLPADRGLETPIEHSDELAVFPPVSGG